MNGFGTLARKEVLEQRRTWKFAAMAAVLALPAVLGPTIFAIVTRVRNDPHGLAKAEEALQNISGAMTFLGVFLAIIIAMGLLAGERASGTAAMTLSKPVTRSAFVAAKVAGLTLSIFGAVAIASAVAYLLTLLLFADGGLGRFALGMLVNAGFLLFMGSVAFFWSAMFTRPLLAGGLAFATFITLNILRAVPHAERYLPVASPDWAQSIIRAETNDAWPAFAIACGAIAVLSVAAWALFRRKEL